MIPPVTMDVTPQCTVQVIILINKKDSKGVRPKLIKCHKNSWQYKYIKKGVS